MISEKYQKGFYNDTNIQTIKLKYDKTDCYSSNDDRPYRVACISVISKSGTSGFNAYNRQNHMSCHVLLRS